MPSAIDVGPDGYIYVDELTGTLSVDNGVFPTGHSRVWKIPADENNATCAEDSGPCKVIIDGLTSAIDLEFGPHGLL